jgi:hypothetical protein
MTALKTIVASALFAAAATAQIPGLCNTGETPLTRLGCSGIMVPPNPSGGGANRDDNWELASPYPSAIADACALRGFVRAWVDTPNQVWIPDAASPASEWITPYDGEGDVPAGSYIYRTTFHVPLVLPRGVRPTGVTINGRLASDNQTYGFYMSNLADGSCSFVSGLPVPLNSDNQYDQWTTFSFTNPIAITPGSDLLLYVRVENSYNAGYPLGSSPTGLRVEFFGTSAFH